MNDSVNALNVLTSRKALFQAIACARMANVTLVILGPPGSGKTEITQQVGKMGTKCLPYPMLERIDSIPDTWVPNVLSIYASQVTGEDLVGFPYMPPGETNPDHFEFVPGKALRALREGDFFIGDEFTTPAAPSTVKAFLQIACGERLCIGDYIGPKNVTRILLGNRPEDGNVDFEYNPVVGNRVVKYEYMGPTADEWVPWALEHDVHPVIATVIRMEPALLNAFDAEADRSGTPRSWMNASRNLLAAEHLAGGRHNIDIGTRMQRVASAVGDASALKLESIFELQDKLVPFGTIVADPENAPIPDPHREPAAHFLTVTHVGNRTTPETWRKVCAYIARLPVEMQGIAIMPIRTRHPELVTTPEFMEFQVRTSGLVIDD